MNMNTAGVLIVLGMFAFFGGLAWLTHLERTTPPAQTTAEQRIDSCINWMSIQARELGQPTTGIKERCKELVGQI